MNRRVRRFLSWAAVPILLLPASTALGADDPPAPGPNRPDEPVAAVASTAKAAAFLDAVALDWTRKRQCGTCHTNYARLIAGPEAGTDPGPLSEVRAFFEGRVSRWDDADDGAKPKWDTEVVATAASLALSDARTTGRLHPLTRRALDRMWTLQRDDGTWDWLKCDWPPYEHDDDYGAAFAAVGVAYAPGDYRSSESARAGLAKLVTYLRETPAPSLHHRAMRLWASSRLDGIFTAEQEAQTIETLRSIQRPDGGWSLPSLGDWDRRDGSPNDKDAPSDGFGTGFVTFVLRESGVPADDPAIRRGIAWLKANQRDSGRWFTRSVSNDKAHYITHAGTAFALMALRACEAGEGR